VDVLLFSLRDCRNGKVNDAYTLEYAKMVREFLRQTP